MLDRVLLHSGKKLHAALFIIPLMQALLPNHQVALNSETSHRETKQEVQRENQAPAPALAADSETFPSRLLPSVSYRHPEISEKGLFEQYKQEREDEAAAEAESQAKAARDIEMKAKKGAAPNREWK